MLLMLSAKDYALIEDFTVIAGETKPDPESSF
jgi:hypothetical protein